METKISAIPIYSYMLCSVIVAIATVILFNTPVLLIAVLYIIMFYEIKKNNEDTIIFFLVCSLTQNLILIIFSNDFTGFETSILILVKELLVYIYFVVHVFLKRIREKKISTLDYIFILFLVITFVSFLKSNTSIGLRIVSLRQIIIPMVCYYFGEGLIIGNAGYRKLLNAILVISGIMICVGIIIYLASDDIWYKIGYIQFWINKTGSSTQLSLDNFYTYDLGPKIKRFVSFTADPLATSHFLGLACLLLYKNREKYNRIFSIIAGIVLLVSLGLGLSKSTLIMIAIAFVITIFLSIKSFRNKVLFNVIGVCIISIFLIIMSKYMAGITSNTSISNHLDSFLAGIKHMDLLGNGLGTAGYTTVIMGGATAAAAYNESFFAVLLSQMGIVGVAIVYSFLGYLVRKNYLLYKENNFAEYFISMILLLSMIIESLFSSSSISMIGTGAFFMLTAICTNYGNLKVKNALIDEIQMEMDHEGAI